MIFRGKKQTKTLSMIPCDQEWFVTCTLFDDENSWIEIVDKYIPPDKIQFPSQ